MRNSLPTYFLIICIVLIPIFNKGIWAQRSAAELISSIQPPRGKVPFPDGITHVVLKGQYLYVTNHWAGLQVVDIKDITHPQEVAFLPTRDEAGQTILTDRYAFLSNYQDGVQVFDIEDPGNVKKISRIQTPGNALWVDYNSPYLYVALGDSGFAIYEVSNVENPSLVSRIKVGEWVQQLDYSENLLYLAAKKGGLIIFDVSNPSTPQKLAQFRTGFNTMKIQVEQPYAYIADGPGGLLIMNVENPKFPLKVSRVSQVGFVGDLHKVGSYAYLANRDVGLQIVNVNDPEKPFIESYYPTNDKAYGVFKEDIYVYLAANTSTLILRHNNAPRLTPLEDQHLLENTPFTLQLEAVEPDGDPILFQALNLPEGATFDEQTGVVHWTPTYEQAGTYPNIIFRVIEQTQSRLSSSDTISFLVENVNRYPDLPSLEDKVVAENTLLQFTIPEGSDPDKEDQNRLSYRAEKLPEGATFDPVNRTFSWTPTFEQSGVYVVDFLMDDGNGGIDREPITITVTHVDRKPTIDPIANQVIDEGAPFTLQLTGTELDKEDQDKISFRMENLPQGATFDQVTNTFQWTPTYDQSGTYENIVAIMQAGVLSDTTIFSITVNHVNRAPVLADVEDQQVDENSNLSFTISGSDPDVEDQGKLVFQALNLPEGATFDAATRTFSWTPTYEQSGIYSDIQFQVMDPSGLKDSKTMTITVNHVNRPPKLMAVEPSVIDENELLSYTLSANDPDKEDDGKLRFSAMGLPEGASLDPVSGQFQWTPTYDQSGEYAIIFMVSDGQYQDSSQTTITVNHVNRPPVLTPLPVFTVDENKSLVFNVEGSDPDKEDAGKLSFTISNLPEGATFDPLTRQFQWTPTYEQSGEYLLPVSVTDPGGLSAQQDVRLVVHHVNRPPQLNPIPPIVLNERELVSFQLMGTDPDKEDTGRLSYSLTPIPEGANFNPKTGEFVWTPTYEQSGSYTLTAVVSDADGLQDTKEIVITVNNVNRKPRFLPMSSPEGKENSLLTFNLQATDPDKEDEGKLRFSAASLPEGATLNPQTGEFRWTPTYDQSGSYPIVFTVEDAEGASASVELTISVIHVNRAPNLPSPGTLSFTEGQRAGYKLPEGTDPDPEDAGKLTYHIKNAPGGIEFDPETRMLSWTPSFDQAGEYQAIYWVSDGQAHKEQPLILVVENVNQPPTIEAPGVQTVNEGQELTFEIKAIDPDKEDQGKLKVSASNVPAGASFNGTEFRWTPGFDQQGTYTINFTVSDPQGLTAQTSVTIEVNDIPQEIPPADTTGGGGNE